MQRRILWVERGERITLVRVAMGVNGDAFALVLEERLAAYGFPRHYDKAKISRIESGTRDLTCEEAAVIAGLDPERRGLLWLIFGKRKRPPARESRA